MGRSGRSTRSGTDLYEGRVDRIVAAYVAGATIWIIATGPATAWLADWAVVSQTVLEVGKGLLFVLVTAAGLRIALRGWARRMSGAAEREREAAARVREAEEMRTAFLRGVSHELRTPLTSIVGYADTVQHLCSLDRTDEIEPLLGPLVANAHRLERLVLDLLETNALLDHQRGLRLESVDVADLVRRVVASVDLGGREVELVGGEVVVDLDVAKIERVLTTLLGNVARHTPTDTHVTVAWTLRAGELLVIVEDDGPGFADGVDQRVFEPFVQGEIASAAAQPGVGIGLSLVAEYVRLHGGRTLAANRADGGARVEVHIPVEVASRA